MELLDLITLGVAILPTVVIMVIVLFNAKEKREPFKKIASVFAISAFSVIPAGVLELIGEVVLAVAMGIMNMDIEDTSYQLFFYAAQYLLVVGPAEEACKFFTFKWIIFHDREFDNTYDGVIYGAASALGFATLENLMYVFLENGSPLETAVMRALLSVPMHAVTGIVMGYYFGISKYRKYNNVKTDTHPESGAFIFSVILHGLYDLWVTMPYIYPEMSDTLEYGTLAVIMMFIYITLGRTVYMAKKNIHAIYNAYYYEYLDGKFQDMVGGKTSNKKMPRFFGVPLPQIYARTGGFNPYDPYANISSPPPPMYPQTPYQQYIPPNPYTQQNYTQQGGYMPPPQQGYPYTSYQAWQPQPQQQYRQPEYMPPAPAPPPEPAVYCTNCGTKAKAGQNYCVVCGNKIQLPNDDFHK